MWEEQSVHAGRGYRIAQLSNIDRFLCGTFLILAREAIEAWQIAFVCATAFLALWIVPLLSYAKLQAHFGLIIKCGFCEFSRAGATSCSPYRWRDHKVWRLWRCGEYHKLWSLLMKGSQVVVQWPTISLSRSAPSHQNPPFSLPSHFITDAGIALKI